MKQQDGSTLQITDAALPAPLCPVDRLPRRRRNKICISVMALGALTGA